MTARIDNRHATRLMRLVHSVAVKAVVLMIIFIACPAIVYVELRSASDEKTELLTASIQQQGRLIAVALTPLLRQRGTNQMPVLQSRLREIAGGTTKVKIFFRPAFPKGPPQFFYVASAPAVSAAYLDDERAGLIKTGIFDGLLNSCAGDRPLALRYSNPAGETELLSSLTPVRTAAGCWVVLTSIGGAGAEDLAIGQPYWKTPEVRFAALIYLLMAILVLWLFLGIWWSLRGFSALARGTGAAAERSDRSFADMNKVPELATVAKEFDRMVHRLATSAQDIRTAAEENAHAFKTPIAVIAQSIEPLKKTVPQGDERGQRALHLIERATERLDALVGAARQMDAAIADLINPPQARIDLSNLLERMLDAYQESAGQAGRTIVRQISPGVLVCGSEDMFEIVAENLLDNALSFAPEGSEVGVRLTSRSGQAELVVNDRGPGVDPGNLERIFERYFSDRRRMPAPAPEPEEIGHFGMGLWIVRRNLESVGGSIEARNRTGGGLELCARLPLAT